MDFAKLNSIAAGSSRTLKKIADLDFGQLYMIEEIKKVHTKYGDKVVVDLYENICCYLPSRLSKYLLQDEEAALVEL